MRTKKDRRCGNTGGHGTKMNERNTHMNDITKKPIAQGSVETEHFRAEVTIYGWNNVHTKIEMKKTYVTDDYGWITSIADEYGKLFLMADDFAMGALNGRYAV